MNRSFKLKLTKGEVIDKSSGARPETLCRQSAGPGSATRTRTFHDSGSSGSDRQFMRAPRPPPLWSVALHLLHYREVPAWKVPVDDESADVISQDLCSGPSPRAPAGYWCNGLSLVSADLDARAVHSLATNDTHTRRALEAGGCCCEVCQAECLSSYVYNCTACTGAVTPACAACYLSAQNHYNLTGACWDPPPSLPTIPLGPPFFPAPSSPEWGIDVMGMILCAIFIQVLFRICYLMRYRRLQFVELRRHAALLTARNATRQAAMLQSLRKLETRVVGPCTEMGTDIEKGACARESSGNTTLIVDECAICLCTYQPGEVATLLPCKHEFHHNCIHKWLVTKEHLVCPLCKAPVPLSSDPG